jgi:hypothetical protein
MTLLRLQLSRSRSMEIACDSVETVWKEAVAVCCSVDLLYVSKRQTVSHDNQSLARDSETRTPRYEDEVLGTRLQCLITRLTTLHMVKHTCICCTSESVYMNLDSSVGKVTDCGSVSDWGGLFPSPLHPDPPF